MSDTILSEIGALLLPRKEATEFVALWQLYTSAYDDEVDEVKDIERTFKVAEYASKLYNCAYWRKYGDNLRLLERVIHNEHKDSVRWERANEEWKRTYSKCFSTCAMKMLFAVIVIEFGDDKLDEISLKYREFAYNKHKDDNIG